MKAFTLIEIILVFAIIGIITTIGIGSFSSYNSSQVFGSGVSEVASLLRIARSRAISQVKPANCGATPLDGYRILFNFSGLAQDYEQDAICGSTVVVMSKKKLPGQLKFQIGPSGISSILFDVSTGTVSAPGNVIINGYGKNSTINIDSTGNVKLP